MTIKQTIKQIEDEYGKGAIMKLGDNDVAQIDRVSTGSLSLNLALGGGIPRGRVIEIYGKESSGKTTLASHIIAEFQRQGGTAAFIDAEHALDPEYARKIGVDVDNLLISQPATGEQALDITESLIRSGEVDVVVVDSVAALTPRAEIEGDMGEAHMGLHARLMSQAMRKITAEMYKTNTTVIFINQVRMKIGIVYGNPEVTTGGNALKFYSSIRLDMRTAKKIENKGEVVGVRAKVKVAKNKVAPPFKVAEFDILYNQGISLEADILDIACQHKLIEQKGAYFKYEDLSWHGRSAAIEGVGEQKEKILKQIHAISKS